MTDYKKLYEDAIFRMNKWVEGSEIIDPKEVAEFVFPELKESEDEKIRKDIISFVKQAIDAGYGIISKERKEKWIAWLEKQGEQLPVGFYYVNSNGEKFYSDTFKCGDFTFHVENQGGQKETLCDKCRKEQPSHSCQDITELGRCSLEHQSEQKLDNKSKSAEHSYITPNSKFFQWIYDRLVHVHNENPNVDYMLSLKERIEDMQKPTWSEEDEEMMKDIIDVIQSLVNTNESWSYLEDQIDWLKSIKDRI